MPIHVACPKCRQALMFDDAAAGRVARCSCGQDMTLPQAPSVPESVRRIPTMPTRPVPPRAGGGSGVVLVLLILVGMGAAGGFVYWMRAQKNALYRRAVAEHETMKEEMKRAEEESKRYVMVRWGIDDAMLPADKRTGAEAGKFVGIRVEIVNHGYESVMVDPLWFLLKGADGARIGRDVPIASTPLTKGDLQDGEKTSGGLAFEVPDATKSMSLEFQPPSKLNVKYGEAR